MAKRLADAGARGLSLSLDALDPDRHDRFRNVRGAWRNTVEGAEILNRTGLPFIVQTTAGSHNLGELDAIADFAHDRLAAKVWNLYFLVPTGRGQFVSDITPAQYDDVLASLYRIQRKYDRRMLVNAKCAPHYIKTVLERARGLGEGPEGSPAERDPRASGGGTREHRRMPGRLPARPRSGPTPEGPVDARRERTTWGYGRTAMSPPARICRSSRVPFAAPVCGPVDIIGAVCRHPPPHRARRPLRGVRDERPLRRLPRPGVRDDRRCDGRGSTLHPHPRHVRRLAAAGSPRRVPGAGRAGRSAGQCGRSSTVPNRLGRLRGTMPRRRA